MLHMVAASVTLRAMVKGQVFWRRQWLTLATTRLGFGLCVGVACASGCDSKDQATLPQVSYDAFVEHAYPVLMRDCAFPACHGNSERLFQVYGPGRARLPDPEKGGAMPTLSGPVTKVELDVSFARARSMLLYRQEIEQAPLLRKPVQGGAHFGTDLWGRNVFASKKATGFVVLRKWAEGADFASKPSDKDDAYQGPASLQELAR